jgi:hypothetical protein
VRPVVDGVAMDPGDGGGFGYVGSVSDCAKGGLLRSGEGCRVHGITSGAIVER